MIIDDDADDGDDEGNGHRSITVGGGAVYPLTVQALQARELQLHCASVCGPSAPVSNFMNNSKLMCSSR